MASDQLHLDAVEHSQRIDQIILSLESNEIPKTMQVEIAQMIRFFGRNIVKLQECNEAMIKLANMFLNVQDKKMIQWELRDSNAFLLMITTLLLKRRDESVIRQASLIMKRFVFRLPKQHLKSLVLLHRKHIQMIFHKISKVSTYFTQVKLLDVIVTILEDQNDLGENDIGTKIIQQEARIASCSDNIEQEMVRLFHNVDRNNFMKTSRDFLDFYNREFVPKRFIYSLDGYLMKINGKQQPQLEEMKIDFNLRNLSISFFINDKIWKKVMSFSSSDNSKLFVELDECDVAARSQQFNNPNHIELNLRPLRSQILNKNDDLAEDSPSIESLIIVVEDELNLFMSQVYQLLKDKTPMMVDNMTDNDSIASYRTASIAASISTPIKLNSLPQVVSKSRTEATDITFDTLLSISSVGKGQPQFNGSSKHIALPQLSEKSDLHLEGPLQGNIPARNKLELKVLPEKKRQTAKIEPTVAQAPKRSISYRDDFMKNFRSKKLSGNSVYDELPSDDEILPSVDRFMVLKRLARERKMQSNEADENMDPTADPDVWKPKSSKKTVAKKKPAPVKKGVVASKKSRAKPPLKPKKNIGYETDDEDSVSVIFPCAKQTKTNNTDNKIPAKTSNKISMSPSLPAAVQSPAGKKTVFNILRKTPVIREPKNVSKNFQNEQKTSVIYANSSVPTTAPVNMAKNQKKITQTREIQEAQTLPNVKIPKKLAPVQEIAEVQPRNVSSHTGSKRVALQEIDTSSNVQTEVVSVSYDKSLEDEQPVYVSEKFTNRGDEIANPLKAAPTKSSKAPVRKKRVSFNDCHQLIKRTRSSSYESDDNSVSSASLSPELIPESQRPQQQQQPSVVFNMDTLNQNEILGMYINDSMTIRQENGSYNLGYNDELIEVRTKTVQKKTSPSQIRTVQIQEINFSSSPVMKTQQEMVSRRSEGKAMAQLTRCLESKALKALEPLMRHIEDLRSSKQSVKSPEMKAKLRTIVSSCRESKQHISGHVKEHVKLLKRLHHSKRQLMQYADEDKKNIYALKTTLKQAVQETRKTCKERLQQIEEIKQSAINKEKEIKTEVWRDYLNNVSNSVQQILQSHYSI